MASIRKKLHKNRQAWSLLLLMTFGLQAMFAQGFMPGSGTWVELCTSDSASLQLVYLDGEQGSHSVDSHEPCVFSAVAALATHTPDILSYDRLGFGVLGFYQSYALSAYWPAGYSRAPPHLLS